MKYILSWVFGAVVGGCLILALLYYNPFAERLAISPLAVGAQPLIDLSYSTVPTEAIAFTNNGESRIGRHPGSIGELWEPAIRNTSVMTTRLKDSRGRTLGIGIKFTSASEDTRLLNAQALQDSAWHVYLPNQGSFLVDQVENMWAYIRHIVLPARWSRADSWRGTWYGITTAGPNALGTARVSGASGQFAGMTTEAVEALSARAYSAQQGPVSVTGNLTVAVAGAGQEIAGD